MELTILNVTESKDRLIVEIEKDLKINRYSFPLSYTNINPITNKPEWQHKLKEMIETKTMEIKKAKEPFVPMTLDLSKVEDMSDKALHIKLREKHLQFLNANPEKLRGEIPFVRRTKIAEELPKPRTLKHSECIPCNL